jgi:hypothetical protein
MMWRLYGRWERWLDGVAADPQPPPRPLVQPPPRGLPAVIAKALEGGKAQGLSQREIARRFNTSKSSVQRAQRLVGQLDRV